jgi:hypothetical protein
MQCHFSEERYMIDIEVTVGTFKICKIDFLPENGRLAITIHWKVASKYSRMKVLHVKIYQ